MSELENAKERLVEMKKENDSLHTATERNRTKLAELQTLEEKAKQWRVQEQNWKVNLNDLRVQLHEEVETRLALVEASEKELQDLRAEKRNLADKLETAQLAKASNEKETFNGKKRAAEEIEVLKKALEAKDALVEQVRNNRPFKFDRIRSIAKICVENSVFNHVILRRKMIERNVWTK